MNLQCDEDHAEGSYKDILLLLCEKRDEKIPEHNPNPKEA